MRLFPYVLILILSIQCLKAQIPNPKQLPYNWKTDTSKHTVRYKELKIVAEKDAIHTLDFPKFITRNDSLFNFYQHEPVIVFASGTDVRAYPLSILTLFELSNDSLNGKQIMVTFCPTCNTSLVFNRNVKTKSGERLLQFGISGLLMHNDMVMYDKETESWWEQLMGSAIAGEYSGVDLDVMPSILISVKDYFDRYPDGKILSPEYTEAFYKKHTHRPFHNLEHHHKLTHKYYLPEKTDPRLPPLEHILDLHLDGHDRIYPFHALAQQQVVNETVGKTALVVFYHGETISVMDRDNLAKSKHVGSATAFNRNLNGVDYTFVKDGDYFVDEQTHSKWDITGYCREGSLKGKQLWIIPHSNHFAFAYLAFYPNVEIYGQSK